MNRALRLLADARPADLDAGGRPVDPSIYIGHQRLTPGRRRRRWVVALAPALALAAVAGFLGITRTPTPGPQDQPQALTAHQFLLAAADTSAVQAKADGAYWVTVEEQQALYKGNPAYAILGRTHKETWQPTRTGPKTVLVGQWLGAEPASEQDKAAWIADGSPKSWTVPGGHGRTLTVAPGPKDVRPAPGAATYSLAGGELTYAEIRALPADPEQLKARLLQGMGSDMSPTEMLFLSARDLLTGTPVTPAVRAATYRMLSSLSGLTLTENVRDARGRAGSAVAYAIRNSPSGAFELRYVIDPATGALLSIEQRVIERGVGMDWPAGTLFASTLELTAEFGDGPPPSH